MAEWFEDWFASEDYLLVYDNRDYNDAKELAKLILKETDLPLGSSLLDAGCGAGRHSILFTQKGFKVTGFDLSDTLLNEAVKKAEENNIEIKFVKGDFRTVEFKEKFDIITNLFTSFGYFESDKENFIFPKKCFNLLNPGGFYILDYFNGEYLRNNLIPHSERTVDGLHIIEERSIMNRRVNKIITLKKSGIESKFKESVKLYTVDEIISRFEFMGYKLKNLLGSYTGNKFDLTNSPRAIMFFRK